MPQLLNAIIKGEESGLKDALNEVRDAASGAATSLEKAQDSMESIKNDAAAAAQSLDSVSNELEQVTGSSGAATESTENLGDELSGTTIRAETLEVSIDSLTSAQAELIGATSGASQSLSQEDDSAEEAADSVQGLGASLLSLAGIQTTASATSQNLSNSLDEVEDEANQATAAIAGTASMSELLSLQSSALSINVGAFTVALRNLTTQVPLLVTSLGNLTAAFAALGGAIAGVGLGGFGVALGGAVSEVEGLAGESATLEQKFAAIQAIGEEFLSMLSEAIRPLVEMEGAAAVFKSLLEEIATTVNVFSKSIAESFTDGPLKKALGIVSDAWMQSIQDIADAMEGLVAKLGVPIANVMADGIRALDGFIRFVTKIGSRVMDIFGNLKDGLGTFIEELILLGLTIAEGLEPILSSFINIVGTVVENINELNNDTVKTAVTVAGLFFAFNRLAGILGSVITPLALVAGTLSNIIIQANSFSQAFLLTIGSLSGGLASVSSGFGKLSNSIATAIPFITAGESNINKLARSMNGTGGPLSMMRRRIRASTDDFNAFGFSVRESMNKAISSIGRFVDKRTGLSAKKPKLFDFDFSGMMSFDNGSITPPGMGSFTDTEDVDPMDRLFGFDSKDMSNAASEVIDENHRVAEGMDSAFDGISNEDEGIDKSKILSNVGSSVRPASLNLGDAFNIGDDVAQFSDNFAESIYTVIPDDKMNEELSGLRRNTDLLGSAFSKNVISRKGGLVSAMQDIGASMVGTGSKSTWLGRRLILLSNVMGKNISVSTFFSRTLYGTLDAFKNTGNAVLSFADRIGKGLESVIQARGRVFELGVALEDLSASSVKSALSFSSLKQSLVSTARRAGASDDSISRMSDALEKAEDKTSNLKDEFVQFAGKEQIAADSAGDLEEHLRGVIDEAKITQSRKEELNDELTELSAKSNLAGQSVDELEEELLGAGFTAEMVDGNLDEVGEEMTEMSVRASLTSAVMTLFNGVLGITSTIIGGLAITLGAIVAALAAVVVIMGTAAALLMTLGSSGKSVDDIMDSLKQTLLNIADTMMPLFVASGNMMLDIFDSLVAPVKALVSGFTDIAIALGFMSEKQAKNASGMGVLKSAVSGLVPVVQAIGDAFRLAFGYLTIWLRKGLDKLEKFLVKISFGDKIRMLVDAFGSMVKQIKAVLPAIMEWGSVLSGSILSILGNIVSSTLEVISAFLNAFGLDFGSAFAGSLGIIMALFNGLMMLIEPTLNLLGSITKALTVLTNALINGLAAGLKAIAGIIGFVVDGIMAFISGLTGGMSGDTMMANVIAGFELIMKAIGPIINAVAAFIDMGIAGFKVFTTVLGEVWGLFTGIIGVIGQLLMPTIQAFGGLIRAVFKDVIVYITGMIDAIMNVIDAVVGVITGDLGIVEGLKKALLGSAGIIFDTFVTMAANIGTVLWNAFESTLNTFVDSLLAIPSALIDAFTMIGGKVIRSIWVPIAEAWNNTVGGFGISIGGKTIKIPTLPGEDELTNNGSNSNDGVSPEEAKSVIADNSNTEESLKEGVSTLGDGMSKDGSEADSSSSPNRIEYSEGDTIQNFRQNISANPEDEAQISRIAKDAMKEANSFARRQQGGQ